MCCRIATSPSFKDGDMLTRKLSTQSLYPCILKLEHFFFTLLCVTVETLLNCPWSQNLSHTYTHPHTHIHAHTHTHTHTHTPTHTHTHTHTNYWYSRHERLLQIQLLIQHTTSPFLLIVIVSLNLFNHNAMPTGDYSDTHCFGNSCCDGWSVTSSAVVLRMFD